ncbi:MAG: hypothetical protein JOZ17_10425 [Acetobacteraceae bacterium]|nr:hypothetical protein [Acetobacteraceae bacterium]
MRAKVVDPLVANRDRPVEIWHARDGIMTYSKLRGLLQAAAAFQATGAKLNAIYVYDNETGLKLFGNTALYVARPDGEFAAFLRRDEAERYAASAGGKVITFSEALATASS